MTRKIYIKEIIDYKTKDELWQEFVRENKDDYYSPNYIMMDKYRTFLEDKLIKISKELNK